MAETEEDLKRIEEMEVPIMAQVISAYRHVSVSTLAVACAAALRSCAMGLGGWAMRAKLALALCAAALAALTCTQIEYDNEYDPKSADYKPPVTVMGGTKDKDKYLVGATVTIYAATPPAKHIFDYWTSTPPVAFADSSSDTTTFTMIDKPVTVTARFKDTTATITPPTTHTITFDANGATSGTAPSPQTVSSGSIIILPGQSGLSRTDHTFGGWDTDAAATVSSFSAGASYTVTNAATLYAVWIDVSEPIDTVTFDANGATSGTAPSAETVSSGSSIVLPGAGGLLKPGHAFGGWNTNAAGTGVTRGAGTSYTVTGNVIFYARWINTAANSHTITFDANGGSGTPPAAQTENYGTNITLPDGAGLERTGYAFAGWNVNSNGTGTNYDAGDTYTVTADTTLFAKWTSTTIAVTNVTLNTTTLSLTVGDAPETLKATVAPSNATNKDVTWSSSNTDVATVSSGGVVTAVSEGSATITVTTADGGKTATCAVTVSAGTTPTYVVTVNSDGADASGGGNYAAGVTVTINAGTAPDGYEFKNWTTSSAGVTFADTSSSQTRFPMPANDVTVTAVFETVNLCKGFEEGTTRPHGGVDKPQFCDERDGQKYVYVTIGDQDWMAENLNYEVPKTGSDSSSYCYDNKLANCEIYGRLYNWNTAMAGASSSSLSPSGVRGVCPSGWHLPSDAEWTALTDHVGDTSMAGKKLKSQSYWNPHSNISSTDDFGFSALPGGYRHTEGTYGYVGNGGYWWSATEGDASSAYYRRMENSKDGVSRITYNGKIIAFSVRCVRN